MLKLNKTLKWLYLSLSIFISFSLQSQETKPVNNYFKISLASTNYLPLQIKTQGVQLLESQISPSAEIGIAYTRHLPKKWGLELGLSYSQMPFNVFHNFYAKNSVFQTDQANGDHFRLTEFDYFSARLTNSLFAFKDVKLTQQWKMRIGIGLNFDITKNWEEYIITESVFDETGQNSNLFFEMTLNNFTPLNFYLSYITKLGVLKEFKNQNYLLINFVGCYAPTALYNGNFAFHNIEYESKGTLKFRPSYIGIEFNYAFALKSKRNKIKAKT